EPQRVPKLRAAAGGGGAEHLHHADLEHDAVAFVEGVDGAGAPADEGGAGLAPGVDGDVALGGIADGDFDLGVDLGEPALQRHVGTQAGVGEGAAAEPVPDARFGVDGDERVAAGRLGTAADGE